MDRAEDMPGRVPLNGLALWLWIHVPVPLMLTLMVLLAAEATLGGAHMVLPWVPDADVRWALLTPAMTSAVCVVMLHTGLGRFEWQDRARWRRHRAAWAIALMLPVLVTAGWVNDSLDWSGSLRNRVLFYALTVLASLVLPPALAALPSASLVLLALLTAGAGSGEGVFGLLAPAASPTQLCVVGACATSAVIGYAWTYPPRHGSPLIVGAAE